MTSQQQLWALVRQNQSLRLDRNPASWMDRLRWAPNLIGAVALFLAATGWGPKVHFSLDYVWYASWLVPIVAYGVSNRLLRYEETSGTLGWWLSLPQPRRHLVLSKWLSAGVMMPRQVIFLAWAAGLGLYVMVLNGTASYPHALHFLEVGVVWTAAMGCLVPGTAAIGVLLGVLNNFHLRSLEIGVWAALGLAVGLLVWGFKPRHRWYLSIRRPFTVVLKPEFLLLVALTWVVIVILLALATHILDRSDAPAPT